MSLEVDIRKKLASFDLEVSLNVGKETLGFLGASGCGKSMTLRCVAGVETPDEGKIVVNGVTYFDSAAKINLSPQERKTALLFQNFQLFPHMTVAKNIAAGIDKNISPADRKEIVRKELERFSLIGFENRYPLQLSGGQQQRVALARMLAAHPSVLMLDEPFSALDVHLKARLEQYMLNVFDAFDGSILYVSHDIDEAYRMCDHIAVVDDGKIESLGTPAETVGHPTSVAAIKLSGCKNVTACKKRGSHQIFMPEWGIDLQTEEEVPDDVAYVGLRAFLIRKATSEDTCNVHRARVVRVSDSRFERSVMLEFEGEKSILADDVKAGFLSGSLVHWKEDKLALPEEELVENGDMVDIFIPSNQLYLVTH